MNAQLLIGWRKNERTLLVDKDVEAVLCSVGFELVIGDDFGGHGRR